MDGPPGTTSGGSTSSMGPPPGMPSFPPMPPSSGPMGPGSMPPPPVGPPGTMPAVTTSGGPPNMPPPGMGPPPNMMGMGPPGIGPPPPPGLGPPGINMGPPPMGPPGLPSRMPPNMMRGTSNMKSNYNQTIDMGPPGMVPPSSMNPWDNQCPPGWGRQGRGDGPPGWDDQDDDEDDNDDESDPSGPPLPSLLTMKIDTPEEFRNKPPSAVGGVVLPKALEEALAYKDQRQAALGDEADKVTEQTKKPEPPPAPVISTEYDGEEEGDSDEDNIPEAPLPPIISKQENQTKASKTKRKKKKKKAAKQKRKEAKSADESSKEAQKTSDKENEKEAEIEYVQENIQFHELEPMYRQFHRILESFKITERKEEIKDEPGKDAPKPSKPLEKVTDQFAADEEAVEKHAADEKERLSKRKLKKLSRLSVAELKQLVARPDVVEMYDVTARDPKLLVQLKAHRNTVQVPRHWCYKRKYLQGKRGIEKPPFDLPDFIKKTGIMEMRASLQDKEETKTLKAKMRERTRPKLGKIDIDYQKLHDAFFKWQTKPRMTIHGDLYYEGKEYETRLREKKPGDLSEELRTALGMPVGPGSHKVPPPWLIAQQRYGPPPSYPNLKIPGLNAPIPEGCAFGYHAGGWGKPPVDEAGKPLYGDVFGHQSSGQDDAEDQDIDRTMWGELESESEEESEEEESDEGEKAGEGEAVAAGVATPGEGLVTPLGTSSVPPGLETPDTIELRKKKMEDLEGGETPALYQVVPERRVGLTSGMMASTHVYDINAANPGKRAPTGATSEVGPSAAAGVEVALDPSELELEPEAVAARYERHLREHRPKGREDLSDMLADHVARQKNKRKRQQNTDSKQAKKYKEFKF
ncbi:Splicing factor 3B subunit 2 [Danaus plexippus plexippus]|uniref:Splicing factor 3B subunit 2 n=1 Tax=Danaus plexippus plexippus TaxID=278856 RepID=A0A212FLI8_DANPL|nr:Splicing factor 3B subunit 2 [Danaus plexippus plexippus]